MSTERNKYIEREEFGSNPKIIDGMNFANAVKREKAKHFIGEKVAVRGIKGEVIGIYPHFLELKTENYKMSVSYKDLLLGGIE